MRTLMIVIAASSLWAQEIADKAVELRLKATMEHEIERTKLEIAHLVNGPVVKNAPYSAEAVTETVQVLSDGNRIESKSTTKIFRDAAGRERREENGAIFINDPVDGKNFVLRQDTANAQPSPKTFFTYSTSQAGVFVRSGGVVHTAGTNVIMLGNEKLAEPVEEKLGARTIEGVEAEGTRTTVTIPAGEIGNVRPIDIVDERWTSPELGVIVYSRHSDPREGVTEYRLLNISRTEQPRTLFDVPADYVVPENIKKGVIRMNVK